MYNPEHAKLDMDQLDSEYLMVGKGMLFLAQCLAEYKAFSEGLAKGDLSVTVPPPTNVLLSPMKSLHASLKHLTYQTQQIAKGDYRQRVEFMGEFSTAFNEMVTQLAERQKKLEDEIEQANKNAKALEQSSLLLGKLTQILPHPILVLNRDNHEVLFMNSSALEFMISDADFVAHLLKPFMQYAPGQEHTAMVQYVNGSTTRHFSVSSHFIEWRNTSAEAFVVTDVSVEKEEIRKLENFAYRDSFTQLYNRFYGMQTLSEWLDTDRQFSLVMVDLDRLKFVNDTYGHNEGDQYIINTANHLHAIDADAVVCRIGGDEFMILVPDIGFDETFARMSLIYDNLRRDEYVREKDYEYSLSFGVATVDQETQLSMSDLLSLADRRMYQNKNMRKMNRRT
jgi:diguanylate cyclase (GGDEF)-like protein